MAKKGWPEPLRLAEIWIEGPPWRKVLTTRVRLTYAQGKLDENEYALAKERRRECHIVRSSATRGLEAGGFMIRVRALGDLWLRAQAVDRSGSALVVTVLERQRPKGVPDDPPKETGRIRLSSGGSITAGDRL